MKTSLDNVAKVIDVSYHNGAIDWPRVAQDGYGAVIRCGYGDDIASQDDVRFAANAGGAAAAGVPFGVYLYSYAQSMAQVRSEAAHVLRLLNAVNLPLALPVFLDLEEWRDKNGNLTWQWHHALEAANEFSSIIKAAGYEVGVYASLSAWQSTGLANYDRGWRWVAAWRDTLDYPCALWQYTSNGTVPGINGRVDMNNLYVEVSGVEPDVPSAGEESVDALARAVIRGEYGNGSKRKKLLGDLYEQVQNRVNEYYQIAQEVRLGRYQNQPQREVLVSAAGYDYPTVQRIVNQSVAR